MPGENKNQKHGHKVGVSSRSLFKWSDMYNPCTLPETNIAPEYGWLEYYFPIGEAYFQGLC